MKLFHAGVHTPVDGADHGSCRYPVIRRVGRAGRGTEAFLLAPLGATRRGGVYARTLRAQEASFTGRPSVG